MKQKCDVLIIGQGIAGSCLAYFLLQQGIDVQIIASPTKPNASKIAGGLMQRVSGQYLALPKLVQDHFDEAVSFYESLNLDFNCSFRTLVFNRVDIVKKFEFKLFMNIFKLAGSLWSINLNFCFFLLIEKIMFWSSFF